MRRSFLIAVTVALAAACACGEQSKTPAADESSSLKAPEKVTVYFPKSPVKPPQLLPMQDPPEVTKNCNKPWVGEPELSLLVDEEGRPRNVMFVHPTGTVVDRLAVAIASADRFTPGTLDGKPVVVAESMEVKIEACETSEMRVAQGVKENWALRSLPRQKLKKPKDPPQIAELAPLKPNAKQMVRMVRRPDFFGEGESAPVLLYSGYAEYTPSSPGRKGTCQVSLVVDAHGLPENLHVLKGIDPGLDMSALIAVEKYRFFPAIKDDKPVPAAVVVSVDFAPPRN
jgi:TonB family protein